jgi:hypothetical protein
MATFALIKNLGDTADVAERREVRLPITRVRLHFVRKIHIRTQHILSVVLTRRVAMAANICLWR